LHGQPTLNIKKVKFREDIALCYELESNPLWFRKTQPSFTQV